MNIYITKIGNTPISELIKLAKPNFGKGYLNKKYFSLVFNSSKYDGWIVLNESDQLIGFLVVYLSSAIEVMNKVHDNSIVNEIDHQVICIDTIVIHSDYRKKGIGRLLLNKGLQNYNKNNGFVMYAWSQKGVVSLQSLANYYEFKKVKEYPGLWRLNCEKELFICPAKGNSKDCCCSAVLYSLKQIRRHIQ